MNRIRKTVLAVLCLLLCACNTSKNQDAQAESYHAYYQVVSDNTVFIEKSEYYDVSAEMSELTDGTYRYYVFIDNPKIAMYSCKAMVVTDESEGTIMPSIGIVDNSVIMIPNQVNTDAGFVKGVVLSGDTEKSELYLKIMVEWRKKNAVNYTREFFTCHLTVDGAEFNPADQQEN